MTATIVSGAPTRHPLTAWQINYAARWLRNGDNNRHGRADGQLWTRLGGDAA
jgi:hypothetical protein